MKATIKNNFDKWFIEQFGEIPDSESLIDLRNEIKDKESELFDLNSQYERKRILFEQYKSAIYTRNWTEKQ